MIRSNAKNACFSDCDVRIFTPWGHVVWVVSIDGENIGRAASLNQRFGLKPYAPQHGKVPILMEFCWLMGSVDGWFFLLDVTRGVA